MCPFPKSRRGFTMMPLILFMFVIVGLISAGYMMLGPKVQLGKTVEAKAGLEKAVDAIISWSVAKGRLPTTPPQTNEYATILGTTPIDSWGNPTYYMYDDALANTAAASYGGLCGKIHTNLTVRTCPDAACTAPTNIIPDVAFVLLSGGSNYNNQTRATGPITAATTVNLYTAATNIDNYAADANRVEAYDDLFRIVTLEELKNRAGCYGSTQGRLKILNNELPNANGCTGNYAAQLYGDGGNKNSYSWSVISGIGWTISTSGLLANSQSLNPVTIQLSDTQSSIQRTYSPKLNPCAAWKFDEGSGNTVGSGVTQGTIAGTINASTWIPRGAGFALFLNGTNNYIYFNDINYFNIGTPATNKIVLPGIAGSTPINTVAAFNALPVGDILFPAALPAVKYILDGQGTTATPATINASTGSYHFTDSTSISNNVVINNYTSNDDISISGASSIQYDLNNTISSNTTTGDVTINHVVTGDVTLSAWVNFSGRPTQSWCDPATKVDMAIGAIAGKGFLYPAIGYGMYVTQTRQCTSCTAGCGAWSNYKVAFQLRNPANTDIHYVTSDDAIAGGSWTHIVAVLDRNASPATDQIKMYINGVKQTDASNDYQYTTKTLLNFDNTFKFTIGARHDGGSGYGFPYWGFIDDVQFFKSALTDTQINTLYTTGLNP